MSQRRQYVDYSYLNDQMKERRKEQREDLQRYDDLSSVPRTVLPSSTFSKASRKAYKEGRLHCRISQAHLKGGLISPSEQNNGATQKPLQKRVAKRKKK
jgi:hypothetical protein